MSISRIAGNSPSINPASQSLNLTARTGGLALVNTTDAANVSATTGLVLSSDALQAQAMGFDVQNSWETGTTTVSLSSSGSVSKESATTQYTSDVQQTRTAFNTAMGAYWMVETDGAQQQTTDSIDSTVNADGSVSSSVGETTCISASHTLNYVNPFGHALTASQFNADVKQFGTSDADAQAAAAASFQSTGNAVLSQSEDVMTLLGPVPKAEMHDASSTLADPPQNGLSASDEVATELIALTTGVTPADATTADAALATAPALQL